MSALAALTERALMSAARDGALIIGNSAHPSRIQQASPWRCTAWSTPAT